MFSMISIASVVIAIAMIVMILASLLSKKALTQCLAKCVPRHTSVPWEVY